MLVPFEASFEDGVIGDGFVVNGPGGFSIEKEKPIHGGASLRVTPDMSSYLVRKVASKCGVRVTLTVRASEEFMKGEASIATVDAGARRFRLVSYSGVLGLQQDDGSPGTYNTSSRELGGRITANEATTIVLEVDSDPLQVRSSVKSPTNDLPLHDVELLRWPPDLALSGILGVELAAAPGPKSLAAGVFWLDDIIIE